MMKYLTIFGLLFLSLVPVASAQVHSQDQAIIRADDFCRRNPESCDFLQNQYGILAFCDAVSLQQMTSDFLNSFVSDLWKYTADDRKEYVTVSLKRTQDYCKQRGVKIKAPW